MRRILQSAFYLSLLLFTTGCATSTHFTRLPKPEEFKKPLIELKSEYPDLTLKESIWSTFTIFGMPEADLLKLYWGEPHDTGFTFWMLMPSNWVFHPSNYWYWQIEDKKVAALIDRPMLFGYRPHVVTLTVDDNKIIAEQPAADGQAALRR